MTREQVALAAAIVALTLTGYFVFPGHTYLYSDTQIYLPMLERLYDPSLYTRDFMAPHLAWTIYDETALWLRRLTGASFEHILAAEQMLFRALAVLGLYLIGSALRLNAGQALLAAALGSLGATVVGPAVLTVEYEPVPRGFAVSLLVFAIGLAAHGRAAAAARAAALAFLYHAPTTVPFWVVWAVLALRKRVPWAAFTPLGLAAAFIALLAWLQPGAIESQPFFTRIQPFQEQLQRLRAPYNWVSMWSERYLWNFAALFGLCGLAVWRLRDMLRGPLRAFFLGLPLTAFLSIPLSWLLTEQLKWALMPQLQPARATLFLYLCAVLLAALAGLRAQRWIESAAWFTVAFLPPVSRLVVPDSLGLRHTVLIIALALFCAASRQTRAVLPAVFVPAFAILYLGQVKNYPTLETNELRQLAGWARASTPIDAVFLFPDVNQDSGPGIFRVRALRAVYVDWKGGGQVNYFPRLGAEWWRRWLETGSGRWIPARADFRSLSARGIDYIIVRREHALADAPAAFENARYAAYAVR